MSLSKELTNKINQKTKPLGALGELEGLAFQIGMLQETLSPEIINPTMLVFAADHGIAQSGVSAYPQEVTYQMVLNFLQGGAAINVFCKQHQMDLKVVDVGVAQDFANEAGLHHFKVNHGTRNFLNEPAMTQSEVKNAMNVGAEMVANVAQNGCNTVGFGEMGIGNTSSASMLMNVLANMPLAECVGKGTGLNEQQLQQKLEILQKAKTQHSDIDTGNPLEVLKAFGGLEIAAICGGMLEAAKRNMLILVDGFIATAAYLVAYKMNAEIKKSAVFCHQSDEQGHQKMLAYLQAKPLLQLSLRLGEGTGAALALPLIRSAVAFLNEMASFESAGVSEKS